MSYGRECQYCGQYSGRYELCYECYHMAQDDEIIKDSRGRWIRNVKKCCENRFYDPSKKYKLKENLMNEWEMDFFDAIRGNLKSKYCIVPQVNMQTFIETDTKTRNDELYRNLDFVLYYDREFIPFLAIELNGQQHYSNEYYVERDKSVKAILNQVGIPLLTIDIKDLKKMNYEDVLYVVNKVIKHINPSLIKKLFGKETNKMDLSWTEKLIKEITSKR